MNIKLNLNREQLYLTVLLKKKFRQEARTRYHRLQVIYENYITKRSLNGILKTQFLRLTNNINLD